MEIYQPAEDSFFLSEIIEKEIMKLSDKKKDIKVLEIGCGSGGQLQTMKKRGIKKENIFSCDINPKAIKHCNLVSICHMPLQMLKKHIAEVKQLKI